MKWCNSMWTLVLLFLQYAQGEPLIPPECITIFQLKRAMKTICGQQRDNQTLWNNVIDCHRPITDEFMRSSGEALCPVTKRVQDPTDTNYSIAEVYFNICGFVDGTNEQILQGHSCLMDGSPNTSSHEEEVRVVKETWGEDVPCAIGECILTLGL
ncbi:uncharacterized protein LOC119083535 [Bradysia coprophila]|uniref:uncharacterized protein LOC119083535 n=1 Tax=Bradysia coprophila TaxID=38358 RepID=UPI00187D7991|nr:uncharacterized protein LOC119083535 [Bradysia coprophila]